MATQKKAAPTKKAAPAKKAAAAPKVEAPEVEMPTLEELQALMAEINAKIFPENPVNFDEMEEDDLTAQIEQDASEITPTDEFSDEAKATLVALGIEIEWEEAAPVVEKPAGKGGKKAATEKKPAKEKKEPSDPFENPGAVTAIMMAVVDNPEITNEEIKNLLSDRDKVPSDSTIAMQAGDTRKTLAYLKKTKKIK
jgi:hypothetical protein